MNLISKLLTIWEVGKAIYKFIQYITGKEEEPPKLEDPAKEPETEHPPISNPEAWSRLVNIIKSDPKTTDKIKIAALSQFIIESGRGSSVLAMKHYNFGGLKWRKEMKEIASPVDYQASDGVDKYCAFKSVDDFWTGYKTFINRTPYKGWRMHEEDAHGYIMHLVQSGYAGDPNYYAKVTGRFQEASGRLGIPLVNQYDGNEIDPPEYRYPPIKWVPSKKYSSRKGYKIKQLILHYTVSPTAQSAINSGTTGTRQASFHYLIDRNGDLYQLVNEEDKAWHVGYGKVNFYSIGIEHVAMPGQRMTKAQEKTSVQLIKRLLYKYDLKWTDVIGHRHTGQATSCPGQLFGPTGSLAELKAWTKKHLSSEFPSNKISARWKTASLRMLDTFDIT